MRKALLYQLRPLEALVELLASCPVFKGHPPDYRTAQRILQLAGVPRLDVNGQIRRPAAWPSALHDNEPSPAGPQSAVCTFCALSAAPLWHCCACRRSYCAPEGSGCGVLSRAHADGTDASRWACPDCCQLACKRMPAAQAGDAAATPDIAKATMDALATAPAAYPSSSAPLLPSAASLTYCHLFVYKRFGNLLSALRGVKTY